MTFPPDLVRLEGLEPPLRRTGPSDRRVYQFHHSRKLGGGDRSRTCDFRFWRPTLWPLSYTPKLVNLMSPAPGRFDTVPLWVWPRMTALARTQEGFPSPDILRPRGVCAVGAVMNPHGRAAAHAPWPAQSYSRAIARFQTILLRTLCESVRVFPLTMSKSLIAEGATKRPPERVLGSLDFHAGHGKGLRAVVLRRPWKRGLTLGDPGCLPRAYARTSGRRSRRHNFLSRTTRLSTDRLQGIKRSGLWPTEVGAAP